MNNIDNLKETFEGRVKKLNTKDFIKSDPIQIPHKYSKKEDIEISGFLTATIAWGKRQMIINNANKLMSLMNNSPYDFVMNASSKNLDNLANFKHRTFNGNDLKYFIKSIKNIYENHGGLENLFSQKNNIKENIIHARSIFLSLEREDRVSKHFSNPEKDSAAKRINLFIKWMVRNDGIVDFGLWNSIKTKDLVIPLDVHVARNSRQFGLTSRKQNNWETVIEITEKLKLLDPIDPIKYDFALFTPENS